MGDAAVLSNHGLSAVFSLLYNHFFKNRFRPHEAIDHAIDRLLVEGENLQVSPDEVLKRMEIRVRAPQHQTTEHEEVQETDG